MGTSDLHGHCLNRDSFKDAEGNHIGVAKAAGLLREVRAERGRNNTLLFDSGDTTQGAPLATYYNEQLEVRQALIDHATAAGTIDPADFHVVNWRLVREGAPVFE